MTTRYLSPAETAKHIRVALKAAFPTVKFSVRSSSGSISIGWTDGPSAKSVNEITGVYEGKGFDGSIDLAYTIDAWVLNGEIIGTCSRGTAGSMGSVPAWGIIPPHDDAERVNFGAYVNTSRGISPTLANKCIAQIAEFWGGVALPLPVAIESTWTKGHYQIADGRCNDRIRADLSHYHGDWESSIRRAAEDRSEFTRGYGERTPVKGCPAAEHDDTNAECVCSRRMLGGRADV